jgi:Copper binding periplasmic protein CusF
MYRITSLFAAVAVTAVVTTPMPVAAQKPVTQAAAVTETFVIDAIDHTNRLLTLRDEKGEYETLFCGPECQRFDALKVGDKVSFRYYESVVYQIRKPGSTPSTPGVGSGIVRNTDGRPGATISQQATAVVTINAIDPAAPSVTITTSDGKKMSFKVEDKKNLQDVKVGDKVEITYTQALAISVTPPGK